MLKNDKKIRIPPILNKEKNKNSKKKEAELDQKWHKKMTQSRYQQVTNPLKRLIF